MLKLAGRLAAVAALLCGVVFALGIPTRARADGPPPCWDETPWCTVSGTGGGGTPGGGGGGGGSGGTDCIYTLRDGTSYRVACYVGGLGYFNVSDGCYYWRLDPQPPLTDPVYDGHTPGTGAVYRITCTNGPPPWGLGSETVGEFWVDRPAGPVNPIDLAFLALAKIRLDPADIHTAPSSTGVGGLVGLPVWLWTPRTPNTWGPLAASQTSGPVTVSISANAEKIVWNMGDGHIVTCTNPGSAFGSTTPSGATPACGYKYTTSSRNEPNHRYQVTATTTWRVTWNGGGGSGVITVVRVSATSLLINEAQVVVK
jgi:hypothetical protein